MAKYRGKSVRLNKPTRIRKGQPGYGRKKSQVYVRSGSKIKRITFGDPNMRIKKSSPAGKINTKKADQLINNPPGKQKKGKVTPVVAGGGHGGGQGGGAQGQGQDVGLFSPIDTNNHYISLVAAMCNILEDV